LDDRFFVVGTIKLNKSKRSFKVQFDIGYHSGIVSREGILLLLEGKIENANIVVFKNFFCMQQAKRSQQRTLNMKLADPEKIEEPQL
jgi:hypothetical protein